MSDFRKLKVWQEAHALPLAVADVAQKMRGADYLSLRSQALRSSGSIDFNIVEGRGQKSDKKFIYHLETAINSANELESQLLMARDRGAITNSDYLALLTRLVTTRKMLHGLVNKLNGRPKRPPPTAP